MSEALSGVGVPDGFDHFSGAADPGLGGLWSEAEVDERPLAVEVDNEPVHLAVPDVEKVRSLAQLLDLEATRLPASPAVE